MEKGRSIFALALALVLAGVTSTSDVYRLVGEGNRYRSPHACPARSHKLYSEALALCDDRCVHSLSLHVGAGRPCF